MHRSHLPEGPDDNTGRFPQQFVVGPTNLSINVCVCLLGVVTVLVLDCKPHMHCSTLLMHAVFVCVCVCFGACVWGWGWGGDVGGLSECVSAQLCLALLR